MLSTKLFLSKIFLKREQSNCFFRGADRPGVHSLCWPSQLADSVDLLSGVFGRILSVLRGLSYQRAEVDHPSVLMCLDLIGLSKSCLDQ